MNEMKKKVGIALAERVVTGQVLGVGTGSTVDAALDALATRVQNEGLQVSVVTSSLQSAWRCQQIGLVVLDSTYAGKIDWGFDGADAVDRRLRAIKGKGGALLQEKILAVRCDRFVVVVDDSKLTENIAELSYVPVEVIPEATHYVHAQLTELGAVKVELREASSKHGPVITEGGNVLLDATFSSISDSLENEIAQLVGVVDSGLFLSQVDEVLIASAAGIEKLVVS